MDSFMIAVNAVIPFLIYFAFGYGVKRSGIVDKPFLVRMNHVIFRAFFPVMMFNNIYRTGGTQGVSPRLIIVNLLSILALIGLAMLIVPRLVKENPRRGVIVQALYRGNCVLFAVPLAENVFGPEGGSLASMALAFVIPVYNVMAVLILEYFRGGKPGKLQLLKKIVTNPMIMGSIAGALFLFLGIRLPQYVMKPVSEYAALCTPLACFVMGGTLQFSSVRKNLKYLIPTLGVKLLAFPAVIVALSVALGFSPMERFVLFSQFTTPVAAASYSMAQSMGGDGDLASEMVVVSAVVSVFTIFFWVFITKYLGII
ncbi:MAG: AEC family transporter [Eubacteriales bacterium]|nr:AEC family transporter [Eubacteriales bacterium]